LQQPGSLRYLASFYHWTVFLPRKKNFVSADRVSRGGDTIPRSCFFLIFTPSFLPSSTAKRSVRRLRHRSTQGLVLDRDPRMVYLRRRRLLLSYSRSSTDSLRLPLGEMRTLPPMLTLLPSLHRIGSPNRYSATGSPSRISNSCFRVRAGRNS
jgi:hypothetical protein